MGGVQSGYTSVDPPSPQSNVGLNDLSPSRKVLPVDPRSPSYEIARTPIVVEKTPETQNDLDPRSPTPGVVRTPLFNFFKGIHLIKSSPSPLTQKTDSVPQMENSAGDSSIDVTSGLESLSLSEMEENSELIKPTLNVSPYEDKIPAHRPQSTKQAKPKQLFANTRSSSVRSPLRVRNHASDTPTHQVQRHQMKAVDSNMKSSRRQENVARNDKENIHY